MTFSRWMLAPFIACLALVFTGCGTGGRVKNLSVAVGAVTSLDDSTKQLVVTVQIINENVVPVGLSGAKHKLYLNGSYAGAADVKKPIGLPQLTTVPQEAVFTVDNPAALRALAGASANYKIESTFFIEAGEDRLESKASGSGSVSLSALAR